MDEEKQSSWIAAFSIGALVGVLAGILALLAQRFRRQSLPADRIAPAETDLPLSIQSVDAAQATARSMGQSRLTRPAAAAPTSAPTVATGLVSTGTPAGYGGPRWSTPTKYIMGVILFLVALGVLFIGRGVIPIVILAALLALFINPLIQFLNVRVHIKWGTAVGLTYVLVVLVLLLIPLLLLPNLIAAINFLLRQDYRALAGQAAQAIAPISASMAADPVGNSVVKPIMDTLLVFLKNFTTRGPTLAGGATVSISSLISQLAGTLGTLVDLLGPVVSVVVGAVFTLLMALQMSLAGDKMSAWYPDLIPPAYKSEYSDLFQKITGSWVAFLRGQLTLMLVIFLMTYAGNLILGVPSALLLAVIAGLLELIPSVGPTLAAIPAVLLAIIFGSSNFELNNIVFALLVVGLYVLIQFLENQFLVPYIMGDAVDLPPLIVLIGTLAGASAFGILGALLATPIIATGNVIFQFIYRKILEPPPAPPPPEEKSIWDSVKGWVGRLHIPGRKKQGSPKESSKPVMDQSGQKPRRVGASPLGEAKAPTSINSVDSHVDSLHAAGEAIPPADAAPSQSSLP